MNEVDQRPCDLLLIESRCLKRKDGENVRERISISGDEMKQCYDWGTVVKAVCPYCSHEDYYRGAGECRDIIKCRNCQKQFQLEEPE